MEGVHKVGDVMYDASRFYSEVAAKRVSFNQELDFEKGKYVLATFHRVENTSNPNLLEGILQGLEQFAHVIATHSGGVQKEAYSYGIPCIMIAMKPSG